MKGYKILSVSWNCKFSITIFGKLSDYRQISKIKCLCRSLVSIESQKTPQSGASSDGISPPVRIQRGPTDILQALSTTVGIDPTAAHYKLVLQFFCAIYYIYSTSIFVKR